MKKLTTVQTKLLSSPVRSELLVALVTLDRASIRELACYMGRTAKSLYYHLRMLERAGIVRVVELRPSGARQEGVYELTSKCLQIMRSKKGASASAESGLRLALREYKRLLESGDAGRATFVRIGMRLSKRDAKTLRTKLKQIADWAVDHSDPDGERISCTLLAQPLQ